MGEPASLKAIQVVRSRVSLGWMCNKIPLLERPGLVPLGQFFLMTLRNLDTSEAWSLMPCGGKKGNSRNKNVTTLKAAMSAEAQEPFLFS